MSESMHYAICKCGKQFRAHPELVDLRVACPSCGAVVRVMSMNSSAGPAAATEQVLDAQAAGTGMDDDLFDGLL